MNIPCAMVQDLLPLYCDHTCSETTKNMVEGHLTECAVCADIAKKMSVCLTASALESPMEEDALFATAATKWKKSLCTAFAKGLTAALLLSLAVYAGHYGLCKANLIMADSRDVHVTEYAVSEDPNRIALLLETTDGYLNGTVTAESDGNGAIYVSIVRPVIKAKNSRGDNLNILYTVDVTEVESVYYGTPENRQTLWEPTDTLPEITAADMARMHDDRLTAE